MAAFCYFFFLLGSDRIKLHFLVASLLGLRLLINFEVALRDASKPVEEDAENDVDDAVGREDTKVSPASAELTVDDNFKESVGIRHGTVVAKISCTRVGEITTSGVEESFHV